MDVIYNMNIKFKEGRPSYIKEFLGICLPFEITKALEVTGATLSSINLHPPDCDYVLCNVDKPEALKEFLGYYPYVETEIDEIKTKAP